MAAWLFLLPVFSEGVFPSVVKVETAGLLTLAFASVVIRQDAFPFRASSGSSRFSRCCR